MDLQELIKLCLQASVIISVYALGLEASPKDLAYVLKRPVMLVRALLAMYVVMPLLAIALLKSFGLPHALQVTLVALAISPIPPLLPKRQTKGGGHSSFALGLMVCMALLSLVLIPLWLNILGAIFGQSFSMQMGAVTMVVLKMIIGPIVAGMLVRSLVPTAARGMLRPAILLAGWLLPLAGLIILFAMHNALLEALGHGAWIPLLVFIIVGVVVGHLLGGPDVDSRLVLAVSTASRHPGIAFAIAAFNFPQDHGVPALIALYLLVSTIATVVYIKWLGKRMTDEPPASKT